MKTLKNQFASRCELDVNRCELVNSSTGLGSGRGTIDPITVDQILEQAGIDPIEPQAEPIASEDGSSEQSDQAASESVTSEPSGVVDIPGANILAQAPTTIFASLARNPGKK